MRLAWLPVLLWAVVPASAQQVYVCQTPQFWCSFQWPQGGIPDGSNCYCNSSWGQVPGYSIDPYRTSGPASAPQIEPRIEPGIDPGGSVPAGGGDTEECFRGLGNCEGQFQLN